MRNPFQMFAVLLALCAALFCSSPAHAQDPGGGYLTFNCCICVWDADLRPAAEYNAGSMPSNSQMQDMYAASYPGGGFSAAMYVNDGETGESILIECSGGDFPYPMLREKAPTVDKHLWDGEVPAGSDPIYLLQECSLVAPADDIPLCGSVGYPCTMYTVCYWSGNNYLGGSAGMGEPSAEEVEMGAPSGATTGDCLIEKRVYEENGLDYTVMESQSFSINIGGAEWKTELCADTHINLLLGTAEPAPFFTSDQPHGLMGELKLSVDGRSLSGYCNVRNAFYDGGYLHRKSRLQLGVSVPIGKKVALFAEYERSRKGDEWGWTGLKFNLF